MQGFKHALLVVSVIALIAFVSGLAERRRYHIPSSIGDRLKSTLKTISQSVLHAHASSNQNPFAALLKLSGDIAILEHLRSMFTDPQLSQITRVDVEALSDLMIKEQRKAFERVAYFVPPQLGHDAYLQYYWPESIYGASVSSSENPNPDPDQQGDMVASSPKPGLGQP